MGIMVIYFILQFHVMDNSFALKVSKYWKPVDETNPKVYLLPLKELKITGIEHAQLRQYVIAEGNIKF